MPVSTPVFAWPLNIKNPPKDAKEVSWPPQAKILSFYGPYYGSFLFPSRLQNPSNLDTVVVSIVQQAYIKQASGIRRVDFRCPIISQLSFLPFDPFVWCFSVCTSSDTLSVSQKLPPRRNRRRRKFSIILLSMFVVFASHSIWCSLNRIFDNI